MEGAEIILFSSDYLTGVTWIEDWNITFEGQTTNIFIADENDNFIADESGTLIIP